MHLTFGLIGLCGRVACMALVLNVTSALSEVQQAPTGVAPSTAVAAVPVIEVPASVESVDVNDQGDAADDAEIWRNTKTPTDSRVFATDKKSGLFVLDLDGKALQQFPIGRLNNVDLRTTWQLADGTGKPKVLIAASDRTRLGISFFLLDPETLTVTHAESSFVATNVGDPYGMCLYYRSAGNAHFAFVTGKDGSVEQYELRPGPSNAIQATLVRRFEVGSIAEGCVIDDRNGNLYIAEELKGIWRYSADPQTGGTRTQIAGVDGNELVADVEGLTLAAEGDSGGYLIASAQGNNTFAFFSLPGHALIARLRIAANAEAGIDEVTGTDGIAVATGEFGPAFPGGIFVVQDDINEGGKAQNFKFVSLTRILEKLQTLQR